MGYANATVRPVADVALASWTLTGAATAHAALADDSDSSYVEASSSSGGVFATKLDVISAAPIQLQYVQPWIRAASSDGIARQVAVRLYGSGALQRQPTQEITVNGTPTRYNLTTYRAWGNGRAFTVEDLAGLFVSLQEITNPIGSLRVYEVGVDVVFAAAPTSTLDSVTTPVTDNAYLSGSWAYASATNNPQYRYQERIYAQPGNGWPSAGTDDDEIAALDAAGVTPLRDVTVVTDVTTADPFIFAPVGDYRRYVRVADQLSPDLWGPWNGQEWVMALVGAPEGPVLTVVGDPTKAAVTLTIAPGTGSPVDEFQVERSDDDGVTWEPVHGTSPFLEYDPSGSNVADDGSFLRDSDGDGFANGWSPYTTGGGDPNPTGTVGSDGQTVHYSTNTGRKGATTRPRVGDDGSNVWPADSVWVITFSYKSDRANADMLPALGFDAGGFAVTWQQQPTPSATGAQGYSAKVVVGGADVESDLHVYVTGPSNHVFTIEDFQIARAGQQGHEGFGTSPYGTDFYGGTNDSVTNAGTVLTPAYRRREDTQTVIVDRFVPRRAQTVYRARQITKVGSGALWGSKRLSSAWTATSETSLDSDGNAWIMSSSGKLPDLPLCQIGPDFAATAGQDQQAFWPEGRTKPVVVSGTVRDESLDQVVLGFRDDDEFARFEALRDLGEPLLLRTLYGEVPMEQHWMIIGPQVQTVRKGYSGALQQLAQLRLGTFTAWPTAEPSPETTVLEQTAVVVATNPPPDNPPPPPPPPPPTQPAAPTLVSVVPTTGPGLLITMSTPLGTEGFDIFVNGIQVGWPQIFAGAGADGAPMSGPDGNGRYIYTHTGGFDTGGPGLANGTYSVTVAAYNAQGVGPQSNAVVATIGSSGTTGGGGSSSTQWGVFQWGASLANIANDEGPPGNFGKRDYVVVHGPRHSWSQITSVGQSGLGEFQGTGRKIMYSSDALPDNSDFAGIVATAMTGAFDGYWRSQCQQIVDYGFPDAELRPFHEFNGAYTGEWYAVGFPQQYKDLFRRYVDVARSVSQAFTFNWCILLGNNGVDWSLYYPGADHVDDHGCDGYNRNWNHLGISNARWQFMMNMQFGLQDWIDFADLNGKPISFPEWMNCNFPSFPSEDSGDDTIYMANMHDGMYGGFRARNGNAILTHRHTPYFDTNAGAHTDLLFDPVFANSLTTFRAKFGV